MESLRFESAEKIIRRWDSAASEAARDRMIFEGDKLEAEQYLDAVNEIQRSLSTTSIADEQSKANNAIQIAMARLEDEFRNLLISHAIVIDFDSLGDTSSSSSPQTSRACSAIEVHEVEKEEFIESNRGMNLRSTTSIREIDLIQSDVIQDLRVIAGRMVAAGYIRECTQVYKSARKLTLDTSFKELGVEKLGIGDIQRLDWDVLENMIRRWIRAAKISARVLFCSERRLCSQIFEEIDSTIAGSCFIETVKGPALQLLNFAEAISISRRSSEKLFKILDLHDCLSELIPDIEIIFSFKSCELIRVQTVDIISRLSEASRGIISEFENAVLHESSRVPIPGGTIHPLTRYVMNYINLICDYKETLNEIIVSNPSSRNQDDPLLWKDFELENLEGSPLRNHLIWVIVVLQFNLEMKSSLYNDPPLSHLFIMNNVHYIVQKVKKSSDLRDMIGDNYLKKLTGRFRQGATNYQRATWMNVLQCLKDEGLYVSGSFGSGVSRSALRERFRTFNAMFEGVQGRQASWLIPDPQLREELRISISENLIPAYRFFLGRFRSHIESGRHPEHYIKYSVEDVENIVLDLFQGHPVPNINRRRSH